MGSKASQAICNGGVVGHCHTAFAGRDDLDRMEAEDGNVAVGARADFDWSGLLRFAGLPRGFTARNDGDVARADGVRGVFNDPEAILLAQRMDRWHVARLAGEMHGHDNFGKTAFFLSLFKFFLQALHAHVVSARVNIDEIDLGATVKRSIGTGDKCIGRGPEPIAGSEIQREAGDVQGAGRAVHRHAMLHSTVLRHSLLETRHGWALGQKI